MRAVVTLLAITVAALLAGCSTVHTEEKTSVFEEHPGWRPNVLFASATPHSSLFVEIAAVEGMEPSEDTLRCLKDFLQTYCDKPDGIQIVRGAIIPRNAARGYFPEELAWKYMSGPSAPIDERKPAYIFILYYDSTLRPVSAPRLQGRVAAATGSWVAPDNLGYSSPLPYPAAVYINGHRRGEQVERHVLLHEVGHLLGQAPGREVHCASPSCLMYPWVPVSHFTRPIKSQLDLCSDCRAAFLAFKSNSLPTNLRFHGKWLVRQETNYSVWALPQMALVLPKDAEIGESEMHRMTVGRALDIRLKAKLRERQTTTIVMALTDERPGVWAVPAFQSATNDWYRKVSDAARGWLRPATAEHTDSGEER